MKIWTKDGDLWKYGQKIVTYIDIENGPVNDGEWVEIVESRDNFSRVEEGGRWVEPAGTDLSSI